nr:hypothetical protein [Tanacetum cinerariifolium]
QSNDVTRLQALVDKKKVVVTEATIRDTLHLDDAEGVDCLPNEEIFATLARIGYGKLSTKLTFYKAFFSNQWKFLIHTILQSMSAKRTSWNEFSSAMASAMICLATGDLSTHSTKYISPALTQKVFANMRRVGKGCSRVETPLFEGMLGDEEEHGTAAEEPVNAADVNDDQSIPSPTPLTPPPQQPQDILSTLQRRMTEESDKDEGAKVVNEQKKTEEYVEELKQHLEIVPDKDDDVFTKATPLARKVPVVDYQIIHVDNKPRYKIIRVDDTHQLYRSFINMLKIFDREDLETLWNIVKESAAEKNDAAKSSKDC